MPQERTELTQREMERLDYVHNAIHALICDLAGQEVEWDAEAIGEISDTIEEFVCDRLHLMPGHEFAPYIEAQPDPGPRLAMRCATCGSSDVRRDADAAWNRDTQQWELVAVYDNATCEDCGGETHIEEVKEEPCTNAITAAPHTKTRPS